ncbi:MAG: hypothetical protein KC549_18680, partial [Myxococcales bacterium]|nr:hypothetical protein [Myxococcales bacterium]
MAAAIQPTVRGTGGHQRRESNAFRRGLILASGPRHAAHRFIFAERTHGQLARSDLTQWLVPEGGVQDAATCEAKR